VKLADGHETRPLRRLGRCTRAGLLATRRLPPLAASILGAVVIATVFWAGTFLHETRVMILRGSHRRTSRDSWGTIWGVKLTRESRTRFGRVCRDSTGITVRRLDRCPGRRRHTRDRVSQEPIRLQAGATGLTMSSDRYGFGVGRRPVAQPPLAAYLSLFVQIAGAVMVSGLLSWGAPETVTDLLAGMGSS